jgi:hypothetical protein
MSSISEGSERLPARDRFVGGLPRGDLAFGRYAAEVGGTQTHLQHGCLRLLTAGRSDGPQGGPTLAQPSS